MTEDCTKEGTTFKEDPLMMLPGTGEKTPSILVKYEVALALDNSCLNDDIDQALARSGAGEMHL